MTLFLEEAIRSGFRHTPHAHARTRGKGHGRIEVRELWSTSEIDWLRSRHDWPVVDPPWRRLRSIACVQARRGVRDGNGAERTSTERRYYISSLEGSDARRLLDLTRGHWGVENDLHWSLDVCFGEDDNRTRKGHAPENLAVLRRAVLGLLKETKFKAGLKRKRRRCAMDHDYLMKVLATAKS